MFFKNLLTVAFLIFTLFSVVATSDGSGTPWAGTYRVVSDCVTPVRDQSVSVSAATITTGGVGFTDFGFPANTITSDMTGTVGGASRNCKITYNDPDKLNWGSHPTIYSCFDDGSFKCSIYLKEQ